MNEEISRVIAEQSRKINYLLTKKQVQPSEAQFTESEIAKLKSVIALFSDLANEGVSKEELFDQLKYLSDINTFNEVELEINNQYTSTQNGVHANIYNFNFNNYSKFNDLVINTESDSLPSNVYDIFKEGYIILQCTPNLMISSRTNIALNTSSKTNNVSISLEDENVHIKITQKEYNSTIISGNYDQLIGSKTRIVPNKQFYALKYVYNTSAVVDLQLIYVIIDTLKKSATVNTSPATKIGKLQFDSLIDDLPPRVSLMALGAPTINGNEIVMIENLFIINRLKTFQDDLYSAFFNEFSNSNVNSLYGQSAAVGISQLYKTLGSTVRQLTAEYSLESNTSEYVGIDIPEYFDLFSIPNKNKFDVFGNSYPMVYSETYVPGNPLPGYILYYSGLRLKMQDYPSYNLINEIGGQYVTNITLAQTRYGINKSKIKQILSDGTIENLDCWIESKTVDQGIQSSSIQGTWVNVGGHILDAQLDGDFNDYGKFGNAMSINIDGFQLSVDDPDDLIKTGSTYKVMHGYKHFHKIQSQVRFVIHVANASREGSINQNINIQVTVNGEQKNITVPLEKQKIAYGDGEIVAYVAVIDTITDTVDYYTGAVFQVTFDGKPPYPFYATRTPNNVPNNYYKNSTITGPLITYTGNEEFMMVYYGDDGQYESARGINTGGDELPTYNLRRGIMHGTPDGSKPIIGTVVPFLKPIINNSESTYTIDNKSLKMAYMSLISNPRAENFTICGTKPLNIKASIKRAVDNSGGYNPVTFDPGSTFKITQFSGYTNLSLTTLDLNAKSETWINGDPLELPDYQINTFSVSIDDIFLPSTVLDQISLSETIVQLQTAVQFLKYYATYLDTLINNLDRRLTYVEASLSEIVDYLTALNQRSQSSLGFAGNLVSFLGTGIGMFFPLIGLGVSLVGGMLTSVDKIEQGDVIMGSIDLVVGGLMGSLGIYKYNQRLKNKYGSVEIPDNPIVNSNDITIKPGYIIINNDPPPMYFSGRRRNGLMRNTNLDIDTSNGITKTVVTTRLNRQTTLWDDIIWTENPIYKSPRSITLQGVYIETIKESNARSKDIKKEYKYVMSRINADGTIEEKVLNDQEFKSYMDVGLKPEDYVKLELLYTRISVPYNTNLGMDDETNVCLMAANGYVVTPQRMQFRSIAQNQVKKRWQIKHTNSNLIRQQSRSNNLIKGFGPKIGIETVYNAMNPYNQLESSQIDLYQNCISEVELVNFKV